jgi:HAD superfamily hydrolase (TIGR01509 family)
MNGWPRAILFDFDGVIVNSEPLHCQGFRQTFAAEGITLTDDDYYRELIGFDDVNAFRHYYAKLGRPLDTQTLVRLAAAKADAVQDMIDRKLFSALPGVDAFVRAMARKFPLAICSGALRAEIERMLDGIGLREFFPIVVAAEDVSIGKPNPMGYLKTVDLLSRRTGTPLTPADCLVIEDAPTVIRTVTAEGFKTLGVATSYGLEHLRHATYAVKDLTASEVSAKIPELKNAFTGAV